MLTTTKTFAAEGVSSNLTAEVDGMLTFAVTGSFSARISVDRSINPSRLAWEQVTPILKAAGTATLSVRAGQVFRIRCTNYVSGSPACTMDVPDRGSLAPLGPVSAPWDASTNTPKLASGVGTPGQAYRVAVAGYAQLDGTGYWNAGDIVYFDGTVWQKIAGSGRVKLTGLTYVYVNPNRADDSTTDPTNSLTGFKTIQAAVNFVYSRYDFNGQTVQIRCYTVANYTAGVTISGPLPGGGTLLITGYGGTATSAITTNVSNFYVTNDASIQLAGFRLTNTGTQPALMIDLGGYVQMNASMDFGPCTTSHIDVGTGGGFLTVSPYTISGSTGQHWHVHDGGRLAANGAVITITGTPNWTNYFCGVGVLGGIYAVGTTFTGASTGLRGVIHGGGFVRTNLLEPAVRTFFPGDVDMQCHQGGKVDFYGTSPSRITWLAHQIANFTLVVPAAARISSIIILNENGNAVTGGITVGTTALGTDVLGATAVGANAFLDNTPLKTLFSATLTQTLYVSAVTAWNSASLTVYVLYTDLLNP